MTAMRGASWRCMAALLLVAVAVAVSCGAQLGAALSPEREMCNDKGDYDFDKERCDCDDPFDDRSSNCLRSYVDVITFPVVLLFMCLNIIAFGLLAIFSVRQLYLMWFILMRKAPNNKQAPRIIFNSRTNTMIFISLLAIFRAVWFVDPFGMLGLYNRTAADFINNVPYIFLMWMFVWMTLYWKELIESKGATTVSGVRRFRTVLIAFVSIYTLVNLVLSILKFTLEDLETLNVIYNGLNALATLCAAGYMIHNGRRLLKQLQTPVAGTSRADSSSLKPITIIVQRIGILAISLVLYLAVYSAFLGRFNPYFFFITVFIVLRVVILAMAVNAYMVMSIKEPGSTMSTGTMSRSDSKVGHSPYAQNTGPADTLAGDQQEVSHELNPLHLGRGDEGGGPEPSEWSHSLHPSHSQSEQV